jgi:hypothetical protein
MEICVASWSVRSSRHSIRKRSKQVSIFGLLAVKGSKISWLVIVGQSGKWRSNMILKWPRNSIAEKKKYPTHTHTHILLFIFSLDSFKIQAWLDCAFPRGSQLMIWVYEYLNKNIFFRIFYIFPYFLYFFRIFYIFCISYIFVYVCCFVSNICLLNSINVLKLFYTLKKLKYYRATYFYIVLKFISYLTYLF